MSLNAKPELRTRRLLLRPNQLTDAPDVHIMRRDAESMKYSSRVPETEISQSEAVIQKGLTEGNPTFAVELLDKTSLAEKPAPKLIGIVGMMSRQEIGYLFHRGVWGRGYAFEALQAFMGFLWQHLKNVDDGYDFAYAYVDAENEASKRVLQKLGFYLTETRTDAYESHVLGMKRDACTFRMDRPEKL